MTPESGKSLESIEEITERTRSDLIEEEQGDAALDRLIEEIGEQPKPQPTPEPRGPAESEFTCRGCHLVFSRSCLADSARVLCKDRNERKSRAGSSAPNVESTSSSATATCTSCGTTVRRRSEESRHDGPRRGVRRMAARALDPLGA